MSDLDPPDPAMTAAMSLSGDVAALRTYYAQWASTYDEDVASHNYGLPETMVRVLVEMTESSPALASLRDPNTSVVDAGCGTGLVGAALHAAGWTRLTGLDLSEDMAAKARDRGVYDRVEHGVDLTAALPPDLIGAFDVCTIGGVFTVGHIPPDAVSNVARMVRPGGALVVSVREAYYQDEPWQATTDALCAAGRLDLVVHHEAAPYTMDSTARYYGYCVGAE